MSYSNFDVSVAYVPVNDNHPTTKHLGRLDDKLNNDARGGDGGVRLINYLGTAHGPIGSQPIWLMDILFSADLKPKSTNNYWYKLNNIER